MGTMSRKARGLEAHRAPGGWRRTGRDSSTSDREPPADAIGVAGTGRDGREYRLSLFKFFLAEPGLIDANGLEAEPNS
jgi:hypothetical protein